MTTAELAKQWLNLCNQGKHIECVEQLYHNDIVSKEMASVPNALVTGKDNVLKKGKQWLDNVEAFHSQRISEPIVAGDHFSSKMEMDVTFKDIGRQQMEELCVFKIKDDKIIEEHFFYSM